MSSQNFVLKNVKPFDLGLTLDCGQAFRWRISENGGFEGVAMGRYLHLEQKGEDVIFYNTKEEDFEVLWRHYFDIDRDYGDILNRAGMDSRLKEITRGCGGIRILRQEPWEALCSFIISQNNNIPRIKGIIERLCENFGDRIEGGFTFPSYDKLKDLTPEDLAPLRSGFRAKYIIDAAKKCSSGEVNLEATLKMDIDSARAELMKIKGVGPKVADCTLLFGMGFSAAFPMDVWMKRAMKKLFSDGLPENVISDGGIVQQYIFHYARTTNLEI